MPETITPTGAEQDFADDELFFSTTDAKGVIELANSTFVRLSHYSHEELLGAPHNVIRHPDMPGGAFALMWQQIESGEPACVYVDNLAKDGSRYRVVATIVRLGDGYLSVRMRPRNQATIDASFALYAQAATIEQTARDGGMNRRDAAALGAAHIAAGLEELGIHGATGLAAAVLPAEVAAHDAHSSGLPQRPDATGPAADALTAMHELDRRTAALLPFLDELAEVSDELGAAWPRVAPGLAALREGADVAAQPVEGLTGQAADDATYYGQQIVERVASAQQALAGMEGRLAEVRRVVAVSRLRIALMHLHALMVARYAAEMIDGDVVGDPHEALTALARALDEGSSVLADDLTGLERELAEVGEALRTGVSEIDRLRRPLFRWQSTVSDAGHADLAQRVPEHVEGVDELSSLGGRCRLLTLPFDIDAVREAIAAVRAV